MINKQDFNVIMMQEIGLEIDRDGILSDQDSGIKLEYKGKKIKAFNIGKDSIEFNPIDNSQMMNSLFDYFLNKIEKEEDRYVGIYYHSNTDKLEKGYIEVKEGEEVFRSDKYYNDSLKFGDLILKINESRIDINLNSLDKEPIRRRG